MDFKEYNGKFAGDTNAREIIRLSKQYIGNRVLDIGAGSGALIERLPNAIGIDLAPKHPRIIKGNVLSSCVIYLP
jgi:2-polyprenyl-3-methyl-5-hydroxy-6-metoxy-1,4-benzoquinol methylase